MRHEQETRTVGWSGMRCGLVLWGAALGLAGCPSSTRPPVAAPARVRPAPEASRPAATRPAPTRRRTSAPTVGTAVTVKGWKLRVVLQPERDRFLLGEPIYVAFKVLNESGEPLQLVRGGDYRNRLGRPGRYDLRVIDARGRTLPKVDAGPTLGGAVSARPIEIDGVFERELLLPHWARITEPGRYRLVCTTTLQLVASGKPWAPKMPGVPVRVEAAVVVTPADPARLGQLVTELRELVVRGDYRQREKAMRALVATDDPRVDGALVTIATGASYSSRIAATQALGRRKSDVALSGLRRCARSGHVSLRRACAQALRSSPHPGAYAELLKMIGDGDYSVRLTVLHALGGRRTPAATARIRSMLKDGHATVVKEAKRYLKERGAKP